MGSCPTQRILPISMSTPSDPEPFPTQLIVKPIGRPAEDQISQCTTRRQWERKITHTMDPHHPGPYS